MAGYSDYSDLLATIRPLTRLERPGRLRRAAVHTVSGNHSRAGIFKSLW